MGKIWMVLMLASVGLSLICGRGGLTSEALLNSGNQAVELMLTLLGTMTLWSGLLEILAESGDLQRLGRLFRRVLKPLFPGLHDDAAWNAISMNLSANLLGLGNAATPAGIEAAKRLSSLGAAGMSALATLMVLDNAGLQLLPTTVITLRQTAGAANPADVWGMTLLISSSATVIAVLLMRLFRGRGEPV